MTDNFRRALPGARTAPANSPTTGAADGGVSPAVIRTGAPYRTGQVVEAAALRYRSVTGPEAESVEYLLWAVRGGPLNTVAGTVSRVGASARIPAGRLAVVDGSAPGGTRTDGSASVVVTGADGPPANVVSVSFRRGGAATATVFTSGAGDFSYDTATGILTLVDTPAVRGAVAVGGADPVAVSAARGDTFTEVLYERSPALFRWTRNDTARKRFGWRAAAQRWEPFRGGAPRNLGRLTADPGTAWSLGNPEAEAGSFVPGTETGYAAVRLGPAPNEAAYPVVERVAGEWSGLYVVDESSANPGYDWSLDSPPLAGLVSAGAGRIVWNPAFVAAHAGLEVWHAPVSFDPEADGIVGELTSPDLYIAPVPSPVENPILRIGNRAPLRVVSVADETELGALGVAAGTVGVARTTGKLRFSAADIARADPGSRAVPNPSFDPLYLGALVRYDGVALGGREQTVVPPVLLVDGTGTAVTAYVPGQDLYLPDASVAPGMGGAGVVLRPDGTGRTPDPTISAGPRPGLSGLVRDPLGEPGESYLYWGGGASVAVSVVDYEAELPTELHGRRAHSVLVARERGVQGSRVVLGADLATELAGQPLLWGSGRCVPSHYAAEARLWSRTAGPYRFAEAPSLTMRVGGVEVSWNGMAGTYSAADLAAEVNSALFGAGVPAGARAEGSYWCVEADDPATTTLSLNWEEDWGRAGMVPGWAVDPGAVTGEPEDPNWLPDGGPAFALPRPPSDLTGARGVPAARHLARREDQVLESALGAVPYYLTDRTPREDLPGYRLGVHYATGTAGDRKLLEPWVDVDYQFAHGRFGWLQWTARSGELPGAADAIELGTPGVVPETLEAALGGYLRVSLGGEGTVYLEPDESYLLEAESGSVTLVTRYGAELLRGERGRYTSGGSTFSDSSLSFGDASVGDWLAVGEPATARWYRVTSVGANSVGVTPPFPVGDGGVPSAWRLYRGAPAETVDSAVVADVVYTELNPFTTEPMEVRTLTFLGTAGGALESADPSLVQEAPAGTLGVRFGLESEEIPLTRLEETGLGTVTANGLAVPAGLHLTHQRFSLRVGATLFDQGAGLLGVTSFSPDPGAAIEYLTTGSGEIRVGSAVLAAFEGSSLSYVPRPLPAVAVATGAAEVDPLTGTVALSAADVAANAGARIYLGVRKVGAAVALNPVLSSFTLASPVRAGELVEATYYRAVPDTGALALDDSGSPIRVRERLPHYIRREACTRIGPQLYGFNPSSRTVVPTVDPTVHVGPRAVTYGLPRGASVSTANRTISLREPVADPATPVTTSYAVYEARGGETSYQVSGGPVWRPPFRLPAGGTEFSVEGDQSGNLPAGAVVRVGTWLTYIRAATHDPASNQTTVTVWPAPPVAVGSLDPGGPALVLVTDRAVTPVVDPFGSSDLTSADGSFLPTAKALFSLSSETPYWRATAPGDTELVVAGDWTGAVVAGHLVEWFGVPLLVTGLALTEDSAATRLQLGSPIPAGWTPSPGWGPGTVRVSARPVYPRGALQVLVPGAAVDSEPVSVVWTEAGSPGHTLAEGVDYHLDRAAGLLSFPSPRSSGLVPGGQVRVHRTVRRRLRPRRGAGGAVAYPRVAARYGHRTFPSSENGLLGATLRGSYYYDSPDSFYLRSVPADSWVTEVTPSLLRSVYPTGQGSGSGDEAVPVPDGQQGSTGPGSALQEAEARDWAARLAWTYYGAVVAAAEQLLENYSGLPVGDRDGKVRCWVGRDHPWSPPGYEDETRNRLNPRSAWAVVWAGARGASSPVLLTWTDPLLEPASASWDGSSEPVGDAPTADRLAALQALQSAAVRNDLDDRVLAGTGTATTQLTGLSSYRTRLPAVYRGLYAPSPWSRWFPERAGVYGVTVAGIGATATDPGVYSAGRPGPGGTVQSTRGTVIAQLGNGTLGPIRGTRGARLRRRRARARLLGYSATGYGNVDPAAANRPVFLASMVPLAQFPYRDDGLPDIAALASTAGYPGGVLDLITGDPTLSIPAFRPGDRLALGRPDGSVTALGYAGGLISGQYAPVTVELVLSGCLVLLASQDSLGGPVPVTDGSLLLSLTGPNTGSPVTVEPGDSLLVVAGGAASVGVSDPPTSAELAALTGAVDYRVGFDVELRTATGELVDATLPSAADPAPVALKEILGQNPPGPRSELEGEVEFSSDRVLPLAFPATRGESALDSGDSASPYAYLRHNEGDALAAALPVAVALATADTADPATGNPPPAGVPAYAVEAQYPDEIRGTDGLIDAGSPTYPAALSTARLDPASLYYPAPGGAGVGTARPYDLLLVQSGTNGTPALPAGSCGILSVGAIPSLNPGVVEPPRWVSPVNLGSRIQVAAENAQCWLASPPGSSGLVVTEDATIIGAVVTTLDVTSTDPALLVWDDGAGGGGGAPPVGGFNDFMVGAALATTVTVTLRSQNTGLLVPGSAVVVRKTGHGPDILACTFEVSGTGLAGPWVPATALYWESQVLNVTTAVPFFDFAPFNPLLGGPGVTTTSGFHDFVVGYDALTGDGSRTHWIGTDRLSLGSPINPMTARARGELTSDGEPVELRVTVWEVALRLYDTAAPGWVEVMSPVNHVDAVNAGQPFTYLLRADAAPYGVGYWNGTGRGWVRAAAWEGAGNVPVDASAVTYSVLPSARSDDAGPILQAEAIADQLDDPGATAKWAGDTRLVVTAVNRGSVGSVQPGDVVVIETTDPDPAAAYPTTTVKAGTYLVRDAVEANSGTHERRLSLTCSAGDPGGWVGVEFPRVVGTSGSGGSLVLQVDSLLVPEPLAGPTGIPFPATSLFPEPGRVFIVVNESALDSADPILYASAVVSAAYTALNTVTGEFSGLTGFEDGVGAATTEGAFVAAASAGRKVSGMLALPTAVSAPGIGPGLPGYADATPGSRAVLGCRAVRFRRGALSLEYRANTTDLLATVGASKLYAYQRVRVDASTYAPAEAPVYSNILGALGVVYLNWDAFHTTGMFVPAGTRCLLPGDYLEVDYSAAAGLYLEPSFPLSSRPLNGVAERLVDAAHSLTAAEVGVRPLSTHAPAAVPPAGGSLVEYVQLEVRRPRRWSRAGSELGAAFRALRFAYETRRGLVAAAIAAGPYTRITAEPVGRGRVPQPATGGGPTPTAESLAAAGVHAGAEFRLLDADGNVTARAEVVAVESAFSMLVSPALTADPGDAWEVYLNQGLVPQEQSCEQLLSAVVSRELVRRSPNYTTGSGGRVPWNPQPGGDQDSYDASANRLRDTDPALDYLTAEVAPGDLMLVDPAGPLAGPAGPATPQEYGAGPRGDEGLTARPAAYTAGSPSSLDDNRGYYWVTEVTGPQLVVSAAGNRLLGDRGTGDIAWGGGGSLPFALYPTVHASSLSGAVEGQGDLRPTAPAASRSHRLTPYSVEPFGYRVVRPDPRLPRETVELIAATRERTLTWMGAVESAWTRGRGGTYYEFQRDLHAADLGDPADPDTGSGLVTNAWLRGVAGRWEVSPLAGTATCLSILERRLWIGDTRLSYLSPAQVDWSTGQGRPTGPDRYTATLNAENGARSLRNAWTQVRAHRATGTLGERLRAESAAAETNAAAAAIRRLLG